MVSHDTESELRSKDFPLFCNLNTYPTPRRKGNEVQKGTVPHIHWECTHKSQLQSNKIFRDHPQGTERKLIDSSSLRNSFTPTRQCCE